MAPTKDELERENAELRAERDGLRQQLEANNLTPGVAPVAGQAARPERPAYGLSAGEKADLEANGVTISPFTGELLTASREGVKPQTPQAVENDRRETARLKAAAAPAAAGEEQE